MTTFITKEGKFKAELKRIRRTEMIMSYLDPLYIIVKRQLAFHVTNKWLIASFFKIVKHLHGTISNFLKAVWWQHQFFMEMSLLINKQFELKSAYTLGYFIIAFKIL